MVKNKKPRLWYPKEAPFYIRNKENIYKMLFINNLSVNYISKILKRRRREVTYYCKLFGWKEKIAQNFHNPNDFLKQNKIIKTWELMQMDKELLDKLLAKENQLEEEMKNANKEIINMRKELAKEKNLKLKPLLEKRKNSSSELKKLVNFKKRMIEAEKMFKQKVEQRVKENGI